MIVGIVVGVVVLLAAITFGFSVKIVREYQRIVLFRLGRAIGLRGPGSSSSTRSPTGRSWVDLREQFLEIPHQTAITQDNASISIDFIIFYKVVDPAMSVLQVQNFAGRRTERRGDDAAKCRRRHAARRRALQARRHERVAPRPSRRGDRALGREGDDGGGP